MCYFLEITAELAWNSRSYFSLPTNTRLLIQMSVSVSDDRGVGRERAAAGLLPCSEGGSQTHSADHTGHPAAGAGAEDHQANAGEDVLCSHGDGGTRAAVRSKI